MDSGGISASPEGISCSAIGTSLSWTLFLKEHSAIKFVKACPLITGLGWYRSPYSSNSIAQLTSLLEIFGPWIIYLKGWYVNIII
jgi:hypothetical protein